MATKGLEGRLVSNLLRTQSSEKGINRVVDTESHGCTSSNNDPHINQVQGRCSCERNSGPGKPE
jgi:hypothetical protein